MTELSIIIIVTILGTFLRIYIKDFKERENRIIYLEKNLKDFIKEFTTNYDYRKENKLKISEYIADVNTYIYDLSATYLECKKRPAIQEAKRIKELKQETKQYITQYKLMKYEYEYLFELFPELENYIDNRKNDKDISLEDVKDNYDNVKLWVTKEEYNNLSELDKNQLALDRYMASRRKSKWQIGRDYEMYIGHLYEKQNYKVEYTGILKRFEDMGRDLIAQKGKQTLIIQCKYWSKNKVIHENHICQLYGTVIQYNIEHNCKAKPVLVTSTILSETALKFAQYLDIEVIQNKDIEEFPRIKCNINKNKEKIYHLPFDQQYNNVIIEPGKGEFYAWNVREAMSQGYRRAKKYFIP